MPIYWRDEPRGSAWPRGRRSDEDRPVTHHAESASLLPRPPLSPETVAAVARAMAEFAERAEQREAMEQLKNRLRGER